MADDNQETEDFDPAEFDLDTGEPVEFVIDEEKSTPGEKVFVIPSVDFRYLQAKFFAKRPDGIYFNKLFLREDGSYLWDYHVRSHRGHGRSRFGMYIFWRDDDGNGQKVLPQLDVLTPNVSHGATRYGWIEGTNLAYKDQLDLIVQPGVRGYFQARVYNSKHDHG